MIRIGIDVSPLGERNYTGVGVYTRNLVESLARIDKVNEYTLCYRFSRLKEKRLENPVKQENFRFKIIQEPLNFIFQRRLDVFHGPGERLPDYSKPKKVATIHDMAAIKGGDFMTESFRSLIRKRYDDLIIGRKADVVITVSESSKNDILELYGIEESRVKVVYPGVEDGFRPMSAEAARPALKKIGIERPYVLHVGAQQIRKNIVGILRAFRRYVDSAQESDTLLVLCGKPTYGYERIEETVKELDLADRLKVIGHVTKDELVALYAGAKMLCFPSLYEGFGFPIVEAFSCGCPVITSNVTSMPEIAGGAALLVDPTDIDGIVDAMKRLDEEPTREKYSRLGMERAKSFTWVGCARGVLDVYKSLV